MTGGISAIRGFDYQATVILDELFSFFQKNYINARVRPEGVDDLDLIWTEESVENRCYIQIKKPTETIDAKPNPSTWTLVKVVEDLLLDTINQLSGNRYTKVWVLGDEVQLEIKLLINAGQKAPELESQAYQTLIFWLIKKACLTDKSLSKASKDKIKKWALPKSRNSKPDSILENLRSSFNDFSSKEKLKKSKFTQTAEQFLQDFTQNIPDILSRITIKELNGQEFEVAKRVQDQLTQTYKIDQSIIQDTLFRNLRGFINDISKQPNRIFNHEEFDAELRIVWPAMTSIKTPPPLNTYHIDRPTTCKALVEAVGVKAIEVVGASGSGKTSLASEIFKYIASNYSSSKVAYAEVRQGVQLRDVLTGLAFHLRRFGVTEPFAVAINYSSSTEEVLTRIVERIAHSSSNIFLIIDIVDGTCDQAFARDLSMLVRSTNFKNFRIIVLGQESSIRELSQIEKTEQNVQLLNLQGLTFQEFIKLVEAYHHTYDHSVLYNIYNKVTAGREVGLLARLAHSLACSESIAKMVDIAKKPVEQMLPYAERERFKKIPSTIISAAERLICFALPFFRADVEKIFPDDKIGQAIYEMVSLGLLRENDFGLYEMHEIVRSGLEGLIPLNIRCQTHAILAQWYEQKENISAQIFHLEHASHKDKAHDIARTAFLDGKGWDDIGAYVIRENIVTKNELIECVANPNLEIDNIYLLSYFLKSIAGGDDCVSPLLDVINQQTNRFQNNYKWSSAISKIILSRDPSKLYELVGVALRNVKQVLANQHSAIDWLSSCVRHQCGVDDQTLQLFLNSPKEIKARMIDLMLSDRRRDILKPILAFLNSNDLFASKYNPPKWQRQLSFAFQLTNSNEAIEFLASIPPVDVAFMITYKNPKLGFLENVIWSNKSLLKDSCLQVLNNSKEEETLGINAFRVLVFLAEPTTISLCQNFLTRADNLGAFAKMIPAFMPEYYDAVFYINKLLDPLEKIDTWMSSLMILASFKADLGAIYRQLNASLPHQKHKEIFDLFFLIFSNQSPFPEAISLLEQQLWSSNNSNLDLYTANIISLGGLGVHEATQMLVNALNHGNPKIRVAAAIELGKKRSKALLEILKTRLAIETEEVVAVTLTTAIISSGATSVNDISTELKSHTFNLWKCILAMRTGDVSFSEQIVSLASDVNEHWKIRRMAILAAGQLPFDQALKIIMPIVLTEKSPLKCDQHHALLAHSTLASIIDPEYSQILRNEFLQGKENFTAFVTDILKQNWHNTISTLDGLPTPEQLSLWLYERLLSCNFSSSVSALDKINNELRLPLLHAAILRSLGSLNLSETIESILRDADNVWLTIKCMKELVKKGYHNEELALRFRDALSSNSWREHWCVKRVSEEYFPMEKHEVQNTESQQPTEINETEEKIISFDEATQLLMIEGQLSDADIRKIVFGKLEKQQIVELQQRLDLDTELSTRESFLPKLQFIANGHTVAQKSSTSSSTNYSRQLKNSLRAALVVANDFDDISFPWHQNAFEDRYGQDYLKEFIRKLCINGNSDRFNKELSLHTASLFPIICQWYPSEEVLKFVDDGILPVLTRFLYSGQDEIFEGLCVLSQKITTPSIDLILDGLLERFVTYFTSQQENNFIEDSHFMWRGFNKLTQHSRFNLIHNWSFRLSTLIRLPLKWYHKQDIVRVIEQDKRCYLEIEQLLLNNENFEHFHQEELDRLDLAGRQLFGMTVSQTD